MAVPSDKAREALMSHGSELGLTNTPYVVVAVYEAITDQRPLELKGWFHTYDHGAIVVSDWTSYEMVGRVVALVAKAIGSRSSEHFSSHRRCCAAMRRDGDGNMIVVAVGAATEVQARRVVEFLLLRLGL